MALNSSRKGLVMTILMLVLFMLMLAELMTFVILNIGYNNIEQQVSMSASSSNYGNLLRLGADSFAQSSLSAALRTLTAYEYNASLRKDNFITNLDLYAGQLIKNGTLPYTQIGSPAANAIANYMGNLTLAKYNKSLNSFVGGAKIIGINETQPVIMQYSPYTISVEYTENIAINSSGSIYRYSIPVNATLPLNGTYDLMYAQEGILREIRFGAIQNLTGIIGNVYATAGNGFIYGTVINVPSGVTCTGLTSNVPVRFQNPPFNSLMILVTPNAEYITNGTCKAANNYGGLITYQINNTNAPPSVPYLLYSSSSGVLSYLYNGSKVLLYGPGMDTLSIENLRNAIANGYYFASPFAPSYLDRASASLLKQSQNGIFTFSNYNRQAASFSGYPSPGINKISDSNFPSGNHPVSIFAWVKTTENANYPFVFNYGLYGTNEENWVLGIYSGQTCSDSWADHRCAGPLVDNGQWNFIGFTYASGTNTIVYVNGIPYVGSGTGTPNVQTGVGTIANIGGGNSGANFTGSIANVQIYNTTLTPQEVSQLYYEGISAPPISNSGLVGWWPLNGNANDYSGFNNNGALNSVQFLALQNYSRDSIFYAPLPTKVSPIPGVLACDTPSQCSSSSPKLYLGRMPLELTNALFQTANFNGNQNSYVNVGNSQLLNIFKSLTVTAWVNAHSNSTAAIYEQDGCNAQYELFIEGGYVKMRVTTSTGFVDTGGDAPLPTNQWVFVAGTFNITNAGIYTDGDFKGSVPVGNTLTAHSGGYGYIGELVGGCTNYDLNGNLSNVQIYNTSLSGSQIRQLYKEGINGVPLPNADLVAWWPLDGNSNDYSGNGNNGTAYSMTYPYFSGAYPSVGLSAITGTANEWQALGLANTQ
ncbi:MAG: LamG domain-containing protein [Candidatus Micrarchaeia archaeon]